MGKRSAIPVVNSADPQINDAFAAVKENIELLNGSRSGSGGLITRLPATATLADCITTINQIITRLNYDGS